MFVPRTRLLVWFALVTLPLSLVGAMAASPLLSFAGTFAFVLIAVIDAALAFDALRGIRVELPEIVRFSKNREGVIELNVTHSGAVNRDARFGLALPEAFASPHEDLSAMLPQGQERFSLTWPCTPLKRGQFRLETCYLETPSPLGFWARRGSVPVVCELRVYPDLSRERNNLAALLSESRQFRRSRAAANRQRPRIRETARIHVGRQFRRHSLESDRETKPTDYEGVSNRADAGSLCVD